MRAVGVWEKAYPKGRVNKVLSVTDIAQAREDLAGKQPDLAPIVLPAGPTTLPPAPPVTAPTASAPAPEASSWWDRLKARWTAAYGKKEV